MKILFLVPYPIGEAPSQRFRFEQYFDLLADQGITYEISSFWTKRGWQILYSKGNLVEKVWWSFFGMWIRCRDVFWCMTFDRVFIHRECAPVGPPIFEFLITKVLRKKVIYDFDDAIWLPNTSHENRLATYMKFHGKVRFICRWSHRVSCGNDWLASFARAHNKEVVVNPTTIDTDRLHRPASIRKPSINRDLIIGWTGTHSTMPYLNAIVPCFGKLANASASAFMLSRIKNLT